MTVTHLQSETVTLHIVPIEFDVVWSTHCVFAIKLRKRIEFAENREHFKITFCECRQQNVSTFQATLYINNKIVIRALLGCNISAIMLRQDMQELYWIRWCAAAQPNSFNIRTKVKCNRKSSSAKMVTGDDRVSARCSHVNTANAQRCFQLFVSTILHTHFLSSQNNVIIRSVHCVLFYLSA